MLPGIDLLQVFVETAESGSIAAAARKLDMSPSTASRKIATLEREFGTPLLIRTTRQLRLTEGGLSLLAWAQETVHGYKRIDDNLGALQNQPSGTIRFACNDYAAANYLPTLLETFCARYPKLKFSISIQPKPEQLLDASCDLLLHLGQRPTINVIARQVKRYARCLCASPKYLAQYGMPKHVDDLRHHRCITHSEDESREWSFSINGRVKRLPMDPYIEVDSYSAIYRLAVAGLGIARVSTLLLQPSLANGSMVEILPKVTCVFPNGETSGMWLLFPQRKILHRTRLFADFLAHAIIEGHTQKFHFERP